MGKFNKTLFHQHENSEKIAMIARQAPARVLARLSLSVRAKKPCRDPENLTSAGSLCPEEWKTGMLAHTHTSRLEGSAIYILSVGGEKLSVHLGRQLQNMNIVSYLLERV